MASCGSRTSPFVLVHGIIYLMCVIASLLFCRAGCAHSDATSASSCYARKGTSRSTSPASPYCFQGHPNCAPHSQASCLLDQRPCTFNIYLRFLISSREGGRWLQWRPPQRRGVRHRNADGRSRSYCDRIWSKAVYGCPDSKFLLSLYPAFRIHVPSTEDARVCG